MLESLEIENLAVVKKTNISFTNGLNIFTGETGAGKSVILSGLRAVLGMKISKDYVRTGEKEAVITAVFSKLSDEIKTFLKDNDLLGDDDSLIILRKISHDGKTSAKINFHPATISILKSLGLLLINIHGQHDNQVLMQPKQHLKIIDDYGELDGFITKYRENFKNLQILARDLAKYRLAEKESRSKADLYEQQYNDIHPMNFQNESEEEDLEREYKKAEMSKEIIQGCRGAASAIDNGSNGACDMITNAIGLNRDFEEIIPQITDLNNRLNACRIELSDIASSLLEIADTSYVDEERLSYLENRLSQIYHLKKKYMCDFADLLKLEAEAQENMNSQQTNMDKIEKLAAERNSQLTKTSKIALELSDKRKDVAKKFSDEVAAQLAFLNMPDVRLGCDIKKGKLTSNGLDQLEILISTNPGEPLKPMAKIASGGELSRIMLAIKSVIAKRDYIPTMIFDEIDTGVSGKAAEKIGLKLHELSRSHQIICVTHLSQIAVFADNHLLIEKHTQNGQASTRVQNLDKDGRIHEIARILGGSDPGENILKGAEEELSKAAKL